MLYVLENNSGVYSVTVVLLQRPLTLTFFFLHHHLLIILIVFSISGTFMITLYCQTEAKHLTQTMHCKHLSHVTEQHLTSAVTYQTFCNRVHRFPVQLKE